MHQKFADAIGCQHFLNESAFKRGQLVKNMKECCKVTGSLLKA